MRAFKTLFLRVVLFSVLLAACGPAATPSSPTATSPAQVLRLATTTSTQDSGLFDAILPVFEKKFNAQVDVIAVGTGQALQIGARGDADVVLVHARAQEDQFVAAGDGVNRQDVMYDDFVIVGSTADPAGIAGLKTAKEAFAQIAAHTAPFVSRGDGSGTETKEKSIWASSGLTPTVSSGWYFSTGQGMGETLQFANEKLAYTLTDRSTWLAQKSHLTGLTLLLGGADLAANPDKTLVNHYGVIQVNSVKHSGVNSALAAQFVTWLTSVETQQLIADFGKDKYGQALFYPESAAWRAAHP